MREMPPHEIMFHHFHDDNNIPMQGSITSAEFADMIIDLKNGFNLLSAEDWYQKAVSDKLEPKDICLTFDDNLRCQFDIAFPVLIYSSEDRIFRYVRDVVLGKQKYEELMDSMIADSKFRIDDKLLNLLWMDEACLQELRKNGHIIGLHSHTHPINFAQLSRSEQELEYKTNIRKLKEILNEDIISVSHPSNFGYNDTTLEILREMKIRLGFRSDMEKEQYSDLEQPRLDSTLLRKNRK